METQRRGNDGRSGGVEKVTCRRERDRESAMGCGWVGGARHGMVLLTCGAA